MQKLQQPQQQPPPPQQQLLLQQQQLVLGSGSARRVIGWLSAHPLLFVDHYL
jgi:hypothetical protein